MQCGFAARYDVCSTARIIPCRTVTGLRRVSNSKKKKTKKQKKSAAACMPWCSVSNSSFTFVYGVQLQPCKKYNCFA